MDWNAVIFYCEYNMMKAFVAELDQHVLNFTAA